MNILLFLSCHCQNCITRPLTAQALSAACRSLDEREVVHTKTARLPQFGSIGDGGGTRVPMFRFLALGEPMLTARCEHERQTGRKIKGIHSESMQHGGHMIC
jgi:hypothetical protein